MQRVIDLVAPAAKAWIAAAVAAAAPAIILWVQDAGNNLVTAAVGAVTVGIAWVVAWSVPNRAV